MGEKSKSSLITRAGRILGPAVIGVLAGWALLPPLEGFRLWMSPPELESIQRLGEQEIVLRDAKGNSFGIIGVDAAIAVAITADVDHDGRKEVIVGTGEHGVKPGYVMVFESDGSKTVEWNCYDSLVMVNLRYRSDRLKVEQLEVQELFGHEKPYILARAVDPRWFATRLVVFDPETGNVASSYWHPGIIGEMLVVDLDGDGRDELVCAGSNNPLRNSLRMSSNVPVAFCLSPQEGMQAQAAPERFGELPLLLGSWYVAFDSSAADLRIRIQRDSPNSPPNVEVNTRDSRFYYLNHQGVLLNIGTGDYWDHWHPNTKAPLPKYLRGTNEGWEIDSLSTDAQTIMR